MRRRDTGSFTETSSTRPRTWPTCCATAATGAACRWSSKTARWRRGTGAP